jgi:hypothetical protein
MKKVMFSKQNDKKNAEILGDKKTISRVASSSDIKDNSKCFKLPNKMKKI